MALASANDPFNAARTPALADAAAWFADAFTECSTGSVLHLRRLHYRMISRETPLIMRDGLPYENTDDCWSKLLIASKQARYADLVQIEDFEDRRAPEPTILLPTPAESAKIVLYDADQIEIDLPLTLPELPSLALKAPVPTPYHIEIWAEKSTIDDILKPLARQYGLNIVTGVGELSITRCQELVERAIANGGRPVRILYISDFDPAGQSMPVAVARKIEFIQYLHGLGCDIQLHPVVLTYEQCVEYGLPRTPLKESEHRAARFEARFGEGATELDALEALHPGELRRILEAEIERFIDPTFKQRWREHSAQLSAMLDQINNDVAERHAQERSDIQKRVEDLRAIIKDEVEAISRDWRELSDAIEDELSEASNDVEDHLDMPTPNKTKGWSDPLYCSSRGYVEQIDRYKRHQGKPVGRKPRAKKPASIGDVHS